ncbi:hypothetical protein ES705_29786 [subsurface metagenome]
MTRVSDFLAWVDSVGGDSARWRAALADTAACAATARAAATPIERLKTYYNCRKGKKLPAKGA